MGIMELYVCTEIRQCIRPAAVASQMRKTWQLYFNSDSAIVYTVQVGVKVTPTIILIFISSLYMDCVDHIHIEYKLQYKSVYNIYNITMINNCPIKSLSY